MLVVGCFIMWVLLVVGEVLLVVLDGCSWLVLLVVGRDGL